MTTYRERREARAERLRGWADKREAKAEAAFGTADRMADAIPFGQPILVGHSRRSLAHRLEVALNASGRRWSAEYGFGPVFYVIDGVRHTPGEAADAVGIPVMES